MDEYIVITAPDQAKFEKFINDQVREGFLLDSWHPVTYSTKTPYSFMAVMIKFGSTE